MRADKMWRSDQKKLLLAIGDPTLAKVEVEAACQIGAARKQGRMPATHMERELQEYIEALEK